MRRLKKMEKRLLAGPWEVEEEYDFDQEILDFVGYKPDSNKKRSTSKLLLQDDNKALQPKTLEIVDGKSVEEKPCFIYDTPGILNDSQIVRYLQSTEINYLSPERWIVPKTILMNPGNCVFIGGLARLDYHDIKRPKLKRSVEESGVDDDEELLVDADDGVELIRSAESIFVTIMASPNVPIHVTITESADEKYEKLFVDGVLQLPQGSVERFKEFPPLQPRDYTIVGQGLNINACDLVLYGVGWISVASVIASRSRFTLHTPYGRGQSLREKPLLPYSDRRKAGRGVSYRGFVNKRMYGHTRKRSPQFIRLFQKQNDPIYSWRVKIKQKMKREKLQSKEDKRLKRIEQGVVLGKMKALLDQEKKFEYLEEKERLKLEGTTT